MWWLSHWYRSAVPTIGKRHSHGDIETSSVWEPLRGYCECVSMVTQKKRLSVRKKKEIYVILLKPLPVISAGCGLMCLHEKGRSPLLEESLVTGQSCSGDDSCNRHLLWASSNVGISQDASTTQILPIYNGSFQKFWILCGIHLIRCFHNCKGNGCLL